MRILSVTAQKPHSTGSGVFLTETVRAFARLGHENAVVAGVAPDDSTVFPEGTRFYPVQFGTPELPFPVAGMSDEMPYESTRYRDMTPEMAEQFEHAFALVLRRAVEEFDPDVLVCHHLYLLTALVRRLFPERRVVGVCHSTDIRQLRTNPLRRAEIIGGIRRLDRIYCLHRAQREEAADCFGVEAGRISLCGTGYNDTVFYDRGLRSEHEGLRLLFAGKISEKKGVFCLINALKYLHAPRGGCSLRLAGGWGGVAQFERVRSAIAGSGADIELCGRLDAQQLSEQYSWADVFVLPSFYEGFPLVLLEALACGARAVCTDLPGIRRHLDDFVPGHGVEFVAPPPLLDMDTPAVGSLPVFERRLAGAIERAATAPPPHPDLSALTWRAVCARLLE